MKFSSFHENSFRGNYMRKYGIICCCEDSLSDNGLDLRDLPQTTLPHFSDFITPPLFLRLSPQIAYGSKETSFMNGPLSNRKISKPSMPRIPCC